MSGSAVQVDTWRVGNTGIEHRRDEAAVEEPLELRLQGAPFVVTMRTPGADADLAAGFLLAERLITSVDDIRSMRHCDDTPEPGNVFDVMLRGEAAARASAELERRRLTTVTSACGVCGRRSIDDLLTALPRVSSSLRVSARFVASLPGLLRGRQAVFASTGGLHGALIVDQAGTVVSAAEDVGRHNAVDKAIGACVRARRLPLSDHVLFVSGRTSFEIVQKAVVAGIPVVGGVSAPSSLAIELARDAHVMLMGFVRDGGFNVYSTEARLES
jgi:FdhD protein